MVNGSSCFACPNSYLARSKRYILAFVVTELHYVHTIKSSVVDKQKYSQARETPLKQFGALCYAQLTLWRLA